MKRIALLHTVQPVLHSFGPLLQEVVGRPLLIHNLLDEFLATNPAEVGSFTIENRSRLYNDLKSCELTGADLIVVTCSTLTPTVEQIRPFIKVPVIAIDDAMSQEAVRLGSRIKVVATAQSTVEPTIAKIRADAQRAQRSIVIDGVSNREAFDAMRSGDMATHDRLVLAMIEQIVDYDVIVLAQASMAHLQAEAERCAKIPTLSSPRLCCLEVKGLLETL